MYHTEPYSYTKRSEFDEVADHSLAEGLENIRLGDNSVKNLSGSRGSLVLGESLMDSTVVMETDETNVNESIVFGWQKKDNKASQEQGKTITIN